VRRPRGESAQSIDQKSLRKSLAGVSVAIASAARWKSPPLAASTIEAVDRGLCLFHNRDRGGQIPPSHAEVHRFDGFSVVEAGETEVAELRILHVIEKDIRTLQIAVQNSLGKAASNTMSNDRPMWSRQCFSFPEQISTKHHQGRIH
jgi:hypothetical protein